LSTEAKTAFAAGWITAGWARDPNTREWIEVGTAVGEPPGTVAPELGIHDVAEKLNSLEREIASGGTNAQ
jgi:hypothetical protein